MSLASFLNDLCTIIDEWEQFDQYAYAPSRSWIKKTCGVATAVASLNLLSGFSQVGKRVEGHKWWVSLLAMLKYRLD